MQLAQNAEVWPDSLCGHVGGRLQPDSIAHEERSQDVLGVAEQEREVTCILQGTRVSKAGHFVSSITYRDGLTALPWQG